jgi:hypothetical protein
MRALTFPTRGGELVDVVIFDRDEFLSERWKYSSGEHVTIIGPTGSGKTTLGYQLLGASTSPELPGVVLVMKPRDPTVVKFSKVTGYRVVRSWPPAPSIWQARRPPGWVLWPKHTFDPDKDDALLERQFRHALQHSYRRGNRVIFADEIVGLTDDLNLKRDANTIWMRGRSMGCGLWAASQRPAYVPQHAYGGAQHLFLHHDPDKRSRDRFGEIGGVDPEIVQTVTMGLHPHQWLYIKRDGPALCVVDT